MELIRFRKIATLLSLETLKWEYTFAADVLIAIRYESPLVQGASGVPDVSGHDHFGTRHFGTFSSWYVVTSGHVISGQARFGTEQQHYFKLLCTGSSHGPSANSALFRYYSLRL